MHLNINPIINHLEELLKEELLKVIQLRHFFIRNILWAKWSMRPVNSDLWLGFSLTGEVTDDVNKCCITLWVRRLVPNPGFAITLVRILEQWLRAQPILDFLDLNPAMDPSLSAVWQCVSHLPLHAFLYSSINQSSRVILLQRLVHSVNLIKTFLKGDW